jgi:hypothetical protein
MGHDLPEPLLPGLAASVLRHIGAETRPITLTARKSRSELLPVLGRRAVGERVRAAASH